MAIYMLATIRKNLTEIIGVRLYDTGIKQTRDFLIGGVKQALNGKAVIENLGLDTNGEIVGLNGSLDRYVKIVEGIGVVGPSTIVIIKKYANGDFEVVNGEGASVRMTEDALINYAETEGIANGKICKSASGRRYISSIQGEFETEKVKDNQVLRDRVSMKLNMVGGTKYALNDQGEFICVDKTLKKINVPEGIERLADKAFYNCTELVEITLPNTLRYIGPHAFYNCRKLKELKLPYGFERLSSYELQGSSIERIYLPMSMKSVGTALIQASDLKTVYFVNRNFRRNLLLNTKTKKEFISSY